MNMRRINAKKYMLATACFVLGICAKSLIDYSVKGRHDDKKTPMYVDLGKTYEGFRFDRSAERGFVPLDRVYRRRNGIIPDAETAAKVAIDIFSSQCSPEQIEDVKPFRVKLVDDALWEVMGDNLMTEGGGLLIVMQRSDGRVLNCVHYK